MDCVDPVASGESGWLAQVQGALQNVQQDLNSISSDTSNNPDSLALDGGQLEGDAQAALYYSCGFTLGARMRPAREQCGTGAALRRVTGSCRGPE